jgi:outer membrane protein OmpA-like peptidoglycan-associated protein
VVQKKAAPPPAPKAVAAIPKKAPATPKPAVTSTIAPLVPGKQALQVVFGESASKLPNAAKPNLKTLADRLTKQPNLRLQLLAYAGGSSLPSSKARRLSLSRALAVRSFLIENGVRSTRIDVRALGNKTTEEPLHRVDMNVAER